jgi:hypothetical protein
MSAKHTPGPWEFYADLPSTDPNWNIVTNASRMRVLANVHIEPGNETDLANAGLIASAPELLEAVNAFLKYDQSSHDDGVELMSAYGKALELALAAVSKATGSAA